MQKWALPIGAALTGLPDYKDPVNFRQSELAYPDPWKRYKLPVSIYLALCAGLAIALAFMGSAYIKYKEDQVRAQYAQLLATMHKPYTEFEKGICFKKWAGGHSGSTRHQRSQPARSERPPTLPGQGSSSDTRYLSPFAQYPERQRCFGLAL